jgi:hypothetical protein
MLDAAAALLGTLVQITVTQLLAGLYAAKPAILKN